MDLLVLNDDNKLTLIGLALEGKWDELLYCLENTSPDVIRNMTGPDTEEDDEQNDTILHLVAGMENVPVSVLETILKRTCTNQLSMASLRNETGQTPLHIALLCIPERTDVIDCLYKACPETVQVRDCHRLRPIDIITERIIMLEEVIKYSTSQEWEDTIRRYWASASVLVGATYPQNWNSNSKDSHIPATTCTGTFLLHACLQSKDVPFALTQRAMTDNKSQLALPDANGDLPLHIVSRMTPQVHTRTKSPLDDDDDDDDDDEEGGSGEEDEENDDDEGDCLNRVISLYPEAALHYNNEHQLPLIVAIQSGRKWNSGISILLQANPSAIEDAHIPLNVLPYLFEHLNCVPDTTFRILQSQPERFLYNT